MNNSEQDPRSYGGDKEAAAAETPMDKDGGVAAEMLKETRRLAAGESRQPVDSDIFRGFHKIGIYTRLYT